jgi:hypothetical protein
MLKLIKTPSKLKTNFISVKKHSFESDEDIEVISTEFIIT